MFSESAVNSADVLICRPTTSFAADNLDFPPTIAIFQRSFSFSR
jgi:hypothetical protein